MAITAMIGVRTVKTVETALFTEVSVAVAIATSAGGSIIASTNRAMERYMTLTISPSSAANSMYSPLLSSTLS